MSRCARCDKNRKTQVFSVYGIRLCEQCLHLIVTEWLLKRHEIGELARS